MQVQKFDISKKIETLTGAKITRKGIMSLQIPESFDDARSILGDDMWKWARHGYTNHAKVVAGNSLLSAGGDTETKKLIRAFGDAHKTMVEVMEMTPDAATTFLLGKEKFASLQDYMDSLAKGDVVAAIDYVGEPVPTPRWFDGDDSTVEETEGEETSS